MYEMWNWMSRGSMLNGLNRFFLVRNWTSGCGRCCARQPGGRLDSPRPLLLINWMYRCRRCCACQHRKDPESPRPLLLINWMYRCRRCCACQHRKDPESPRPLAVAPRHIRGSQHRPPRIGAVGATPRWRDRPSPFQSARTAPPGNRDSDNTATEIPQPSPASAGARRSRTARRAPPSLARVARARRPLRTVRRTAGERRPPKSRRARRLSDHSGGGTERGSR